MSSVIGYDELRKHAIVNVSVYYRVLFYSHVTILNSSLTCYRLTVCFVVCSNLNTNTDHPLDLFFFKKEENGCPRASL
jgi:hypothetical protein